MHTLLFANVFFTLASAFPRGGNFPTGIFEAIPDDWKDAQIGNTGLTMKHLIWDPPGPGDLRSPCPMLNTMANHDFLPHNGRNITSEVFVKAAGQAFNMHPAAAAGAFEDGIGSNPSPNATFIDLDMLHLHGFIEHDGSLSRRDSFFDASNKFDPDTFDNLLSYFGDDEYFNLTATSNARARHAFDMSKTNPTFAIPQEAVTPIMGENAMMLVIWGSLDNPVSKRDYYEFFFRNERLPVKLGWRPSAKPIGPGIQDVIKSLVDASPSDVPLLYSEPSATPSA